MRGLWFYANAPGFAASLAEKLLDNGFLVLPSGERGDVLSLTPPLISTAADFRKLLDTLRSIL
jgi:4-aminobutyrate aminotransferase-like enzyme